MLSALLEDIQTNGTSEKVTKGGPENKEQMETKRRKKKPTT